jgi:hypothetical protein
MASWKDTEMTHEPVLSHDRIGDVNGELMFAFVYGNLQK